MRRLGELARLNPDAVGTRLGRRGVELVRLARGGSHASLVPRRRAEFFVETVELEYGIENLEPLGFVMRAMLERLAERLSLRALVAGDVTLAFGMSGHRSFSRRIAVAAPSNDVRAILTLINLSLEAAPPEDGVESIRIEIAPRVPRSAQTDMFLPPCPAPDKLQTTIARLAALCGPGNVGMLSAENSHRPEAMRLDPFAPPAVAPIPENAAAKNVTQLVIRAIRPAREIEVMCSREIPEFVRGENLGARVISIAGPWRRDGEWWLGFTVDADVHADSSDEKDPAVTEVSSYMTGVCSEHIRARYQRKILRRCPRSRQRRPRSILISVSMAPAATIRERQVTAEIMRLHPRLLRTRARRRRRLSRLPRRELTQMVSRRRLRLTKKYLY